MRFSLLLISLLILIPGTVVQGKGDYNIRIKINGTTDTHLLLVNYYGDKQYIKDTAYYDSKGQAVFKGIDKLDEGIYAAVMEDRTYFDFMVGKEQNFSLETDASDLITNMRVKGSGDNTMFFDYLKMLNRLSKEREDLVNKRKSAENTEQIDEMIEKIGRDITDYKEDIIIKHPNSFLAQIFRASREPEIPSKLPLNEDGIVDSAYAYHFFKNNFWNDFDFTDERLVRSPIYYNKLKTYFSKVLLQHPDTLIKEAGWLIPKTEPSSEMFKFTVWYLTYTSETSNIMGIDAFFVYMVENYYMTGKAFWVNEEVLENISNRARKLKPILIGAKAPEMAMTDSNLLLTPLNSVNAKYTIVYFWDYSCGHCKKESPLLLNFFNENKDIVKVYAVGMVDDFERWKKHIRENSFNWINVVDAHNNTNFRNNYDLISTPIIYLLDEDKKILAKKISAEQTIDFIKRSESIKKNMSIRFHE